jgi:hypothetical protein
MPGIKLSNSYQRAFGDLYTKTPKAVFAAVAYSYTSVGGDHPEVAIKNFLEEWSILHENGIVQQKPPANICPECEGSGRVSGAGTSVRLDDPRAERCLNCGGSGKR